MVKIDPNAEILLIMLLINNFWNQYQEDPETTIGIT
jgi:hypothetical protein